VSFARGGSDQGTPGRATWRGEPNGNVPGPPRLPEEEGRHVVEEGGRQRDPAAAFVVESGKRARVLRGPRNQALVFATARSTQARNEGAGCVVGRQRGPPAATKDPMPWRKCSRKEALFDGGGRGTAMVCGEGQLCGAIRELRCGRRRRRRRGRRRPARQRDCRGAQRSGAPAQ